MSTYGERLRLWSAGGSGSSSLVWASAASVPRRISSAFPPRHQRHIHEKPRPVFIDHLLCGEIEHALTPRGGKMRKTMDLMGVPSGEIDFQPPPPESSPPSPSSKVVQACRTTLSGSSVFRQGVEHFSADPAR